MSNVRGLDKLLQEKRIAVFTETKGFNVLSRGADFLMSSQFLV
jgi:hypothetical protein